MTDPAQEDISTKTLFVLVILVLVVSSIGAWATVSYVPATSQAAQAGTSYQQAKVGFAVQPPEEHSDSSSGHIALEITGGE